MSKPTRAVDIAAALEGRIRSGEFPPNTTIPKIADLAETYGSAENTVASAVRILARKGLVTSVRAYGTVVLDWRRPRQIRRSRAVYRDERGYYFDEIAKTWEPVKSASDVIWEPAQDYMADLLGVEYGSEVLIRRRAIGEPVELSPGRVIVNAQQVCDTTVPADIAREHDLGRADTGPGGVLCRLEEIYGEMEFRDVSYARMPTKAEVEILKLGGGDTPVLGLAVVGYDKSTGQVLVVNDVRMDGRRWFSEHPLDRADNARKAT